ncbi:MAG: 50S ribosomal protein L11 methyltransferase [Desulfobacteraceae bacterium]|jgi:ribosomal protein L11 methyltransferase
MNSGLERAEKNTESEEKALGPYRDLYVYLIDGLVKERDETTFGDAFLGNWVEDQSSFLFFSVPSKEKVQELVGGRSDVEFIEEHHFTYEEWQGGRLQPVRVENFLIVPPWERVEAADGELRIVLDPGVVFGTGLHPTTQGCLKALAYLHTQVPIWKVLDLGTGSGVLAIAAAFLGAKGVLAVDLNPLAVRTSRRNVALNQLERIIRVAEGNAEDFVDEPAELMMANIHHEVMARLIDTESFQGKDWFIFSGLMRSQVRKVKAQLEKYGLKVLREWDHEMTWYTLLVKSA